MDLIEAFRTELRVEAAATRRMLERVPPESLAWKPHQRSRTLGQVAAHVADIPGLFIAPLLQDDFDRHGVPAATGGVAELVSTFDRNVASAQETLAALSADRLLAPWRYRHGERVVFELPRYVVLRSTALNHLIHHRGQLSVYLRLLDVPLPAVYGPTADAQQALDAC